MSLWINNSVKEESHCEKHAGNCEKCSFYKMREKLMKKIQDMKV